MKKTPDELKAQAAEIRELVARIENAAKTSNPEQEETRREALAEILRTVAADDTIKNTKHALDAAARALHKAGEQFVSYADQHAAKGTADGDHKAATNQQWAERCFDAHDAALNVAAEAEGLKGPRDLDVALDAIEALFKEDSKP